MRTRIYIRADGNSQIGLGHIIRCIALAQMLKNDFEIKFYSKGLPTPILDQLKNLEFSHHTLLAEEDFFNILEGNEIVVLDHYNLGSEYQRKVKDKGAILVCIDDIPEKEFFADLIINQTPGFKNEDYRVQNYTKFALGSTYALLRPSFFEAAEIKRKFNCLETLMICFGGSDPNDLTQKTLQVVLQFEEIKKIKVITGAAYAHSQSLEGLEQKYTNLEFHQSLGEKEMVDVMLSVDLAIIPASGISLEVIAAGTQPIICSYASNQKRLFDFFINEKKLPSFNGRDFSPEELKKKLKKILQNKEVRQLEEMRNSIKNSPSNHLFNFRELKRKILEKQRS